MTILPPELVEYLSTLIPAPVDFSAHEKSVRASLITRHIGRLCKNCSEDVRGTAVSLAIYRLTRRPLAREETAK